MTPEDQYDLDIQRILRAEIADLNERHKVAISLVHGMYSIVLDGPAEGLPSIARQTELVGESAFFSEQWYLKKYDDVAGSRMNAAEHYVRAGAFEGRDPGPEFNSMDYYMANPDAAKANWPALVHYLEVGRAEGRPLF
ncbi:hypothetical protein [Erythrobacter rubeus]|uniref:Uncharacterized protein n=1 Tax=Erythrobacter rubeus TaxID=2760803 RepID=A0ABR8KMV0_9SPHN|nr:hypothetical protein [Erythrobacter rubeus]MBD2841034.1 hypothetical protein [Erythrobacter rubeus]